MGFCVYEKGMGMTKLQKIGKFRSRILVFNLDWRELMVFTHQDKLIVTLV